MENKAINRTLFTLRKLFGFFQPGGLVLIVAFVCVRQGYVDGWLPQVERLVPYFILGIGFLLGWRFHRSRLAFVILILMLADRILYYFGPGGVVGSGNEKTIFHSVAIFLPINVALFYLVRERGILNLQGLFRFLFIVVQPLAVYFLLRENPQVFNFLNQQFLSFPLLDKFKMPQAVLFIYGGVLLIFLIGSLFSKKLILRGFFWSLLAIAAGLHSVVHGSGSTVYFSVAGLIIILSVIETAYAMAYHDELTGLPARRSLNTTMQGLGRRYTIAMLDIDFFKKFNDRYGHDVGDQVLCMVASHISRVGGGGKPFRYGGE
ncbi:MAG: GGDEF domain-containing protein, partial [Desulfobulbaceae bacterium]|nr:GGDEF domain-containing protein [Desulfobulbaceae bacterium]